MHFDPRSQDPPRLPGDDFDVLFDEAIAWARARKAILPDEFYGARLQAVRARSFAVSGLAALDQVQQVADSLAEATAAGQTLREWQKTLPPEAFARGRARRELIFRNAVQTHYGIGRTIQQRENAAARPYLMWDAINDSRTRPTHRAMDGHIAPVGDPIWKRWTPPAGHNCRCTRISLTEAQARARGYPKDDPGVEPDKGWEGDPMEGNEGLVSIRQQPRQHVARAIRRVHLRLERVRRLRRAAAHPTDVASSGQQAHAIDVEHEAPHRAMDETDPLAYGSEAHDLARAGHIGAGFGRLGNERAPERRQGIPTRRTLPSSGFASASLRSQAVRRGRVRRRVRRYDVQHCRTPILALGHDQFLGPHPRGGQRAALRHRHCHGAPMTMHVRLRPTMLSDLDFVLAVERDAANLPFITPWERTQHEGAVRFPDFRHFIVEAGPGTQAAGFVILQGCRSPHRAVELKRIVLQRKGEGLGRACVRRLTEMAFRDLRAHRFWLDVKSRNLRAQRLYESEGFVVEGTLRDAVRIDGGYDSLVVMSMLEGEYAQRVAAGAGAR